MRPEAAPLLDPPVATPRLRPRSGDEKGEEYARTKADCPRDRDDCAGGSAEAHRGTYTDGASALKFFDGYVAQREKALKVFDAELKKNEALADAFTKNPVGTLQERGLLGPLDRINLEALPNPFLPWPFPFCHFHYVLECRWEVHWVCIRIFGFRFCWPVYHLHCKWVVRIHCHF